MKNYLIGILISCSTLMYGQDFLFNYVQDKSESDINYLELQLNVGVLHQIKNETQTQVQIPIGLEKTVVLNLTQSDIGDFEVVTKTGKAKYKHGVHYSGVDDFGKPVNLSITESEVFGFFSHKGVFYSLGKKKGTETYVVLADNQIQFPQNECEVLEHPEFIDDTFTLYEKTLDNCVEAYFEIDYDMYLEEGSVQASIDKMTAIFNVVQTLYDNEDITMVISEIMVNNSPDTYSTSSTSAALMDFRNQNPTYNGDVAALISRGLPNTGGVAYLDALCSSYAYSYSWIQPTFNNFPTYSWTVMVITHEIGHNLGSPHTHDCAWTVNGVPNQAIDGCFNSPGSCGNGPLPTNGGTIMSYCHLQGNIGINFNLGFGQLPGDKIRSEVQNANCLSTCGGGGGCNMTLSINIAQPISCPNGNDGFLIASVSGGTSPFSYLWSNGVTTNGLAGLSGGSYSVTVTDANNCQEIATISFQDPNDIAINFNVTNESSSGSGDGSISTNVSGGTSPFSYLWSNGVTTPILNNLSAGNYSLTVTDNNGCTKVGTTNVESDGCGSFITSFPVEETFESQQITNWYHPSNSDGAWSINSGNTPTNNTGPNSANQGNFYLYAEANGFEFKWYRLQTECLDMSNVPDPVYKMYYHMFGQNMGNLVLRLSLDGGTTFIPIWSVAGDMGNNWNYLELPLDIYNVGSEVVFRLEAFIGFSELSDIAIDDIFIGENIIPCTDPIEVDFNIVDVSCFEENDGKIQITNIAGGVAPYDIEWSNGSTNSTINNLMPGSYGVIITDQTTCLFTDNIQITQPDLLSVISNSTPESQPGSVDGSIELTITGGTQPYTYQWSNGAFISTLNNLSSGNYQFTVTDENDCIIEGNVNVGIICSEIINLDYSESFETDLGAWNTTLEPEWIRWSGETPTLITGPENASQGQYYVYSNYQENTNNQAELTAGCFDVSGIFDPYLIFDYHMFGSGIEFLKVLASKDGQTFETLTIINGQVGTEWKTKYVDLFDYFGEETVTIKFIASMEDEYSNIGLDAIKVQNGIIDNASEIFQKDIQVFPNPFNNELNIIFEYQNNRYELIDISGRVVYAGIFNKSENLLNLNLSSGVYVLKIYFEDYVHSQKIVKIMK